jgi:prevent-host-death family protein
VFILLVMTTVSVAELKARLSEYLAAARRGEDVIVTDRGRPVARLSGLVDGAKMDARVAELVRAGMLSPPRGMLPHDFWDRDLPADPTGRSLELLLEERDEGR